jgi:hypothetical protein
VKRATLLFIPFTLAILACNALTQPLKFFSTPTPTFSDVGLDPNCPNPQPTQAYIDFAVQHNQEYFSSPAWKSSYTVMESRVMVTWTNDDLGAVANFDHVIFCNASNVRLDEYYTDENFDIIFQNYDTHEFLKDCRSQDLRLYELKVTSQGFDYNAKYWVEIVDNDHTRESLLVFPVEDQANMDSYSRKIMPALPKCK